MKTGQPDWAKRLSNLVGKYKPSSDVASFRNDYRDVVLQAVAGKKFSEADSNLLMQAREFLENWVGPSRSDPDTVFSQWESLYRAGKERLPVSVLEAFLRKLPKPLPNAAAWEPIILECPDSRLIDVLLKRNLVKVEDLNHLAEVRPADFYQSVALDLLIERSALQYHLAIWDECVQGKQRAPGLMSREDVAVQCYSVSPMREGDERLLTYLLQCPQDQDRVLEALLGMSGMAVRFCRYLTFERPFLNGRFTGKVANRVRDLLVKWVDRCDPTKLASISSQAIDGSLVIGLIRLAILTTARYADESPPAALAGESGRATERAISHALMTAENDPSSRPGDVTFVVHANELYGAFQDYLRRLPVGPRAGQETPERALRYERFLGARQVIEEVTRALEEPLEANGLRDALEVALFNCGLRPLGKVGDHEPFDVLTHEAESPGILPGDPVVITRPGRCLGNREEGFVVSKAKVRLLSRSETA